MKKIKLNLTNVKEVLSREQLKQIIGGSGSDGTHCVGKEASVNCHKAGETSKHFSVGTEGCPSNARDYCPTGWSVTCSCVN